MILTKEKAAISRRLLFFERYRDMKYYCATVLNNENLISVEIAAEDYDDNFAN